MAGVAPPHGFEARLTQGEVAKVVDDAGLLCHGDEGRRWYCAAGSVLPPHQRLNRAHLLRLEVHDRLEHKTQLAASFGLPQVALELQALGCELAQRLGEDDEPCPTGLLRLVHRRIGVPEEPDRVALDVRADGDADRSAE